MTTPTKTPTPTATMQRYEARRLANAIAGLPGYRVVSTHTDPGNGAAYVIDVEDRITKLTYTITSPAQWIDVRGESAHARRVMGWTNTFPEQGQVLEDVLEVDDTPTSEAAIAHHLTHPSNHRREEPTMQTTPAISTAPAAPTAQQGFNFAQWKAITRKAIEQATAEVERLTLERGRIDDEARQRKVELDGQVADLLATAKKLQKAIDDVDRPARAATPATNGARSSDPKTGPTAPKYGPLGLAWAKEHGGEIHVRELVKTHQVDLWAMNEALRRMTARGELEKLATHHYRVVAP